MKEQDATRLLALFNEARTDADRREAFDQLFAAAYDSLQQIARPLLAAERPHAVDSAPKDVSGLVSEVYIRLVRREMEFHNISHFLALAKKMMVGILKDQARAIRFRPHPSVPAEPGYRAWLDDEGSSPLFIESHDRAAFDSVLDALPPQQRRILELRLLSGLTAEQTADALKLSEAHAEIAFRRAMRVLRDRLEHRGAHDVHDTSRSAASEQETAGAARFSSTRPEYVKAWIERGEPPFHAGQELSVGVRIDLRDGSSNTAAPAPFWSDRTALELCVKLAGDGVIVRPAWQTLRLERHGRSVTPVFFQVRLRADRNLQLHLSIFSACELALLEEFVVSPAGPRPRPRTYTRSEIRSATAGSRVRKGHEERH